MATVTLDRDECDEGFLPPVCIRCGEAATSVRNQHYQWVPPAIHLTMIFCVPYLILLLVMRKKMTVALPVCDRHRWIWLRRQLLQSLGIVCLVAGVIAGITFGDDFDHSIGTKGFGAIVAVTGLLLGCFVLCISSLGNVRPSRITNDSITLKGISPAFADTVEQYRVLLDDDD